VYNYIRSVVMWMKKIYIVTVLLIVFNIFFLNVGLVKAAGDKGSGFSDNPIEFWEPTDSNVDETEIEDRANVITTVIRNIGLVVSVLSLMIIGIREMFSSAEEKSIIKQSMPGYILGAIMIGAITTLPSIIYNVVKG